MPSRSPDAAYTSRVERGKEIISGVRVKRWPGSLVLPDGREVSVSVSGWSNESKSVTARGYIYVEVSLEADEIAKS